jgi:hypothetical protein
MVVNLDLPLYLRLRLRGANAASGSPVNTVAPVLSGDPTVIGNTLTCSQGTWTGTPTITYTYQWTRNTVPISGAVGSTYQLVTADAARTIRCRVLATNAVAAVPAFSNGLVAGTAPVNTVTPVISGTPTVGNTLTCSQGSWTGSPTPTFTYQWRSGGFDIAGATTNTHVVTDEDKSSTLTCMVTATNQFGPVSSSSNGVTVAGTHVLTVGDGGSARGFYDGIFGAISPTTLSGLDIDFLQVNSAGTAILSVGGSVQIPDCTLVLLDTDNFSEPMALPWNPSFGDYRSSGRTDLWTLMGENIGAQVPIYLDISNLLVVPHQYQL